MKTDSEAIEQLAFEMWQIYQRVHGMQVWDFSWKILENIEKQAWINLAVFVVGKLEALADALTASKKKKRKKKPKKKK